MAGEMECATGSPITPTRHVRFAADTVVLHRRAALRPPLVCAAAGEQTSPRTVRRAKSPLLGYPPTPYHRPGDVRLVTQSGSDGKIVISPVAVRLEPAVNFADI
jgi:hypothetical protein